MKNMFKGSVVRECSEDMRNTSQKKESYACNYEYYSIEYSTIFMISWREFCEEFTMSPVVWGSKSFLMGLSMIKGEEIRPFLFLAFE